MLDLLLIPQATNKRDRERDEQRSLRERTEEKAFKTCHENQPKIQRFIPKIHRNEIHHATNLIPKNHCLGLTQTPGNWDRGHARNWGKRRTKITALE
jgi:hypothetical protein